ncbi:bifunctional 4-hydroxy-2-oxoglutarate aldolase/2-dehydro-3-deoxy-phosphogluconate aldolase [Limnobacter humi]|uniref:2-dehydro-3-deoxy-phosphogluconate aldolase n=1 Tax=Limnobacter humi TaxID=1778671 RepID=A0ABT1WJ36_9BURK|nr:bifunctional 4-hydroxy-2-oxoglutarate aldolase/2-dehydro-3-deoxy-phosphogluconate aldolase [Limnobacter humi]MCQ8896752.1 bifunctional 4-hydroxy-2-oxoglutarate aldolase/2-dehydro-3-deoxy-phosphogluconate aldolase [Limnobacter humi]
MNSIPLPSLQAIMPVVVIDTVDQGLAIANGLLLGGIRQIEVTLRTTCALKACEAIARDVPQCLLAVGTVLTVADMDHAVQAGAQLLISPGLTNRLAEQAHLKSLPWIPGVATATDMMNARDWGYSVLKFFPAMAAGGPTALKALSAPLQDLTFIPTGGVGLADLPAWKALPSVQGVGGSWLTANLQGMKPGEIERTVAERAAEALKHWQQA